MATPVENRTRSALIDGYISLEDAQAISPGALSSRDKKEILELPIEPGHVDPAALSHLGITATELKQAAEKRDGLIDKVRHRVRERLRDEVFKKHGITALDIKLGDHVGLKAEVKGRILKDDDPLIANDEHRGPAGNGKHRVWTGSGFGIFVPARYGGSFGVGPANFSFGFSGNGFLGVSVIRPFDFALPSGREDIPAAIKEAGKTAVGMAKAASTDLPFDAKKARGRPRGTEVNFTGRGRVAASGSVGAGKTLATVGNYITVGGTIGAGITISDEITVNTRVKWIDEDVVYVSLSKVDKEARDSHVGAHVGVDANMKEVIPDFGGTMIRDAGDKLAETIDDQLEKWLSIDLRALFHRSKTEKEVACYVLDLKHESARKAYDDLMRLDTRAADKLAKDAERMPNGEPIGPASFAKFDEEIRSRQNALMGNFGPATILKMVSSSEHRTGDFESTSLGKIHYERAKLDDAYFGLVSHLWNGDRDLSRELVQIDRQGAPRETYYRLKYHVEDDRHTSRSDVRKVLNMADYVGVLEDRSLLGNKEFLKSFGKSDTDIDVSFAQKGLEALASCTREEIEQAFAEAYRDFDRPYKGWRDWKECAAPWLNKGHEDYAEVMQILKTGRSDHWMDDNETVDDRYQSLTGRHLHQDRGAWREMQKFIELVDHVKDPPAGSSAAKEFAKAEGTLGLDFWTTFGTAVKLIRDKEAKIRAPGDEDPFIVVSEIAIDDNRNDRQFVIAREGSIQDIDVEIRRALKRGY